MPHGKLTIADYGHMDLIHLAAVDNVDCYPRGQQSATWAVPRVLNTHG